MGPLWFDFSPFKMEKECLPWPPAEWFLDDPKGGPVSKESAAQSHLSVSSCLQSISLWSVHYLTPGGTTGSHPFDHTISWPSSTFRMTAAPLPSPAPSPTPSPSNEDPVPQLQKHLVSLGKVMFCIPQRLSYAFLSGWCLLSHSSQLLKYFFSLKLLSS